MESLKKSFKDAPWPLRIFLGFLLLSLALVLAGVIYAGIRIGAHYAGLSFLGWLLTVNAAYKIIWHRSRLAHSITVILICIAALFLLGEIMNDRFTPFYIEPGFYFSLLAAVYGVWVLYKGRKLDFWVPTMTRLRWDPDLFRPVPR